MHAAKVYCLVTIILISQYAFAEHKQCPHCCCWYESGKESNLCPHDRPKEDDNRFLYSQEEFNEMDDMTRLSVLDEAMKGHDFKIKRFPVAQLIPHLSHHASAGYDSDKKILPWLMSVRGYLAFLIIEIIHRNAEIPANGFILQDNYTSEQVNRYIEYFVAVSLERSPQQKSDQNEKGQKALGYVSSYFARPSLPVLSDDIECISGYLWCMSTLEDPGHFFIKSLSPFRLQNAMFHFVLLFYNSHYLLITDLGVVTVNDSVLLSKQDMQQAILTLHHFFFGHTETPTQPVPTRRNRIVVREEPVRLDRAAYAVAATAAVLFTLFVVFQSP